MVECQLLSQRPDVIQALDNELSYQTSLAARGRATPGKDNGVAGQLVTMSSYLRRAEDAWTNNSGDEPALDVMRKLAAIAIRALILYGCPERQAPSP